MLNVKFVNSYQLVRTDQLHKQNLAASKLVKKNVMY